MFFFLIKDVSEKILTFVSYFHKKKEKKTNVNQDFSNL